MKWPILYMILKDKNVLLLVEWWAVLFILAAWPLSVWLAYILGDKRWEYATTLRRLDTLNGQLSMCTAENRNVHAENMALWEVASRASHLASLLKEDSREAWSGNELLNLEVAIAKLDAFGSRGDESNG